MQVKTIFPKPNLFWRALISFRKFLFNVKKPRPSGKKTLRCNAGRLTNRMSRMYQIIKIRYLALIYNKQQRGQ